jgi:hypothetical protein
LDIVAFLNPDLIVKKLLMDDDDDNAMGVALQLILVSSSGCFRRILLQSKWKCFESFPQLWWSPFKLRKST